MKLNIQNTNLLELKNQLTIVESTYSEEEDSFKNKSKESLDLDLMSAIPQQNQIQVVQKNAKPKNVDKM